MKQDDIYYQAMLARDPRFDGKFFIGVKTTGIYCRPVCPAKPKRENVEFFSNHLLAEKAGYRPCMRCRPESAPQSPVWIGKTAVVKRAIKALDSIEALKFNEDRFAEPFGVSARHLRRLFIEEIGKTPKQISFENRLNLARKLIVETGLPFSEVAIGSGFSSIRRFNDAFQQRFQKPPRELRRNKAELNSNLKLSLPYRPPFDFEGLLHSYERHRVGNLEWFESGRMGRVIHFGDKIGKILISNHPSNSSIEVEIDFPDTSAIHSIVSRVRTLFDLDSDPIMILNTFDKNVDTRKLIKEFPGIRLPSGWDPFEIAISTILGQLVSVDRGRSLVADLIEIAGTNSGISHNGIPVKLFPTPSQIISAVASLKTTRARKETLVEFSQSILNAKISLEPTQDVEDFIRKVTQIKGIGPWTAHYMALKVLRHTDSFPLNDLVLAKALNEYPNIKLQTLSPWKGYLAALLWRKYTQKGKENAKTAEKN